MSDLPINDQLRDLRQVDLNNLVRVSGVVTRRTSVYPQMKSVVYDCNSCGASTLSLPVENGVESRPMQCAVCQARGFKINTQKTEYENYQKVTLQETPGSVPAGRVPRYKDVILLGDLIDVARPGEEVDLSGIYCHNLMSSRAKDKSGFPVFSTVLEANCVHKKAGNLNIGLTESDKRMVKDLAADPQIAERIFKAIAPSIYGHSHVKQAIALALFGGVPKQVGGGGTHRIRGDINILLIGMGGDMRWGHEVLSDMLIFRCIYI